LRKEETKGMKESKEGRKKRQKEERGKDKMKEGQMVKRTSGRKEGGRQELPLKVPGNDVPSGHVTGQKAGGVRMFGMG
jgi:hypothetical protein